MSGHKAIKEWENIPTVYEERKTMNKQGQIKKILEKYGIATRIVTTSSEYSLSYTQEIATDLIEELTALIEQAYEQGKEDSMGTIHTVEYRRIKPDKPNVEKIKYIAENYTPNTKVQQEVEDGVRGFIENKIKGTGGLEERFCDWNAPEYWDIDIKTTPIEVENWVVEQAEQYLKQLKKGEEWVWCTECGKEKVYDGTMCSGCREWLIK